MSFKKIDLHTHVARESGFVRPSWNHENFCTPEQMLAKYDRDGVELGCILPMVNPECAHLLLPNEEAMRIVAEYPARFRWFCNIDPRMDANSAKSDFSYLLDHYKAKGALGVGEICATLPFDDARFEALFRACEAAAMPVLFHIADTLTGTYGIYDEPGLPGLEGALKKFPKLLFFGHSMGFWSEIDAGVDAKARTSYSPGKVTPGRVVQLMRAYPNLMGDLSANSGLNALRRDPDFAFSFLEEFQDRLFFGQDICLPSQNHPHSAWFDEQLAAGSIPRGVYEKVCRGNFMRVFG